MQTFLAETCSTSDDLRRPISGGAAQCKVAKLAIHQMNTATFTGNPPFSTTIEN